MRFMPVFMLRSRKSIERGQIANPVTLKNLFDQDGALAEIGARKSSCSSDGRRSCRAVSASELRWAAPSCASRASF